MNTLSSFASIALPVLPAIGGVVVAQLVALVTKSTAPTGLKQSVAVILSALAGVLATVTYAPGSSWPTYAAAIGTAWGAAIVTHAGNLTRTVATATAGFGLGGSTSSTQPAPAGSPMGSGYIETAPAPEPVPVVVESSPDAVGGPSLHP